MVMGLVWGAEASNLVMSFWEMETRGRLSGSVVIQAHQGGSTLFRGSASAPMSVCSVGASLWTVTATHSMVILSQSRLRGTSGRSGPMENRGRGAIRTIRQSHWL